MSNWLRTYVMPSPGCPLSVLRVKRDLTRGFQKNCQNHMKGLKHKTDSDRRNTIIRGRFAAFMLHQNGACIAVVPGFSSSIC
jgi:hypothetical protein